MEIGLYELARVVGAKNDVSVYPDRIVGKVEFDSRKIEPGDVFVPLKGERDGHDFIEQAFASGCSITLAEHPVAYPHLEVTDCLLALQHLAAHVLDQTGVEVIAVTGSNGKTTTKDMIHAVLSTTYTTYKTQGNYNNEIGLPYTILQMPSGTEKLVLEMGQDHLGDIHLLSMLARPSLGVITLFGEAHLAFFGSREQIAEGKMQLADGMPAGSLLILPADKIAEAYLPDQQELIFFGADADLQVTSLVEEKARLTFGVNFMEETLTLPITGKYNATNAMLAAYVGQRLGVAVDQIQEALANLRLTANRTEWKKAAGGAEILSDVYNANPTAVRLILETFASIPPNPCGKKIVVLADMKELGSESVALHTALLDSLDPDIFSTLIFYGEDCRQLSEQAREHFSDERVFFFPKNDTEDAFSAMLQTVQKLLEPADQLLLKGSNSMRLGDLVAALEEEGHA